MKLYDAGTTIIVILVVAGAIGYFSSRWLGHDNPVEETAEEVIEQHTGIDIDLSPGSADGEYHGRCEEH